MPVIQNSYKIFKLPASLIAARGLSVQGYTIAQGIRDGNVVAIGDNQVFQQLRYAHGDERGHRKIFAEAKRFHDHMEQAAREGDWQKSHLYRQILNESMFVRDVVNVEVDGKKSDFRKFAVKGFDLNGRHYVYLCSGAGQIRRNTATFIDDSLRDQIVKNLSCGFHEKTDEYVLAKYAAYFALSFSSVMWVRTPRVCVIADYFRTIPAQPVDYIVRDSDDRKAEARMERRTMDIEINCADGQGLIDPGFAKLWAEDMDLPFTPCSFVARSAFVKGCMATFDFREYAHEHGISTIKDIWGREYPIDEIDCLVSESQFKTHKLYSSWQEYLSYAEAGRIRWGVARYNKERDAEMTQANYQYIQALTLSKEEVKGLAKPTIEWIKAICSGDEDATLLYLLGAPSEPQEGPTQAYRRMWSAAKTPAAKAAVKNADYLKDPYVQSRVRKTIKEAIRRAKLGRIWVRGNYQFMVSDPVAQCQSALGLDPVGVVPANHVWCDFWRRRIDPSAPKGPAPKGECGPGPWLDICRSPMISRHEHCPSTLLLGDAEADRWLSHMYSGCVFSTYDTATARVEDADFDGDIVLVTDNRYFLKGSNKDRPIITYEKGLAKPAKITVRNLIDTICKGFGSGVGGFSNAATCFYAMMDIFKEGDPRRGELLRRIDLEREIVGQEIDRIKGADKPYLPTAWREVSRVPEGAAPEEARAIYRANSLALAKKPYFFRYLYPEHDRLHRRFEASYDKVSLAMFGRRFKSLLRIPREERTKDQDDLVRRYEKYCPLITSPCAMNTLCREVEAAEADLKFGRLPDGSKAPKAPSLLPPWPEAPLTDAQKEAAASAIRELRARRQSAMVSEAAEAIGLQADDFPEARAAAMDSVMESARLSLQAAGVGPAQLLRACREASGGKPEAMSAAWEILGPAILPLIPQGRTGALRPDPAGRVRYLGGRYSPMDATDRREIGIEMAARGIFGDYDGSGWAPPGEE